MEPSSRQKIDHELTRMMSRMYMSKKIMTQKTLSGIFGRRYLSAVYCYLVFVQLVEVTLRFVLRAVFFLPIRIKNKYAENQGDNSSRNKNKQQFIHDYSPLLKKVPNVKKIKNKLIPTIAKNQENFSGAAILVTTNIIKTACAKLRKTFAKPSLWRLLNFINDIIQQTKMFVKQKIRNIKLCRRIGTGPILFVRCVRLAISRCLSVGYGGRGFVGLFFTLILFLRWWVALGRFFSSVLKENNNSKNNRQQSCPCHRNESKFRSTHLYSPLSIYKATKKSVKKNMNPGIIILNRTWPGAISGPNIAPANTIALKLNNARDRFSRCRLVSFISCIIAQIKMFVKQKIKKLCRRIGTVPIIMLREMGRVCLSMLYGWRGILKYALLLTVILLNNFLVVSVNAKDSEERVNVSVEVRRLKSKKIDEKLSAIERLGKARDKRATQELLNALKTERNINVKCQIIEALGNTRDDAVTDELVTVIKTTGNVVDVRYMAITSLGKKNEKAIQALREVFLNETEDISLRLRALEELSLVRNSAVAFETL